MASAPLTGNITADFCECTSPALNPEAGYGIGFNLTDMRFAGSVAEPSTIAVFGAALAFLAWHRRPRRFWRLTVGPLSVAQIRRAA